MHIDKNKATQRTKLAYPKTQLGGWLLASLDDMVFDVTFLKE
jgi:hypothetical protein